MFHYFQRHVSQDNNFREPRCFFSHCIYIAFLDLFKLKMLKIDVNRIEKSKQISRQN